MITSPSQGTYQLCQDEWSHGLMAHDCTIIHEYPNVGAWKCDTDGVYNPRLSTSEACWHIRAVQEWRTGRQIAHDIFNFAASVIKEEA